MHASDHPIKQYHLHKNDYSKLHFEVQSMRPYFERNQVNCIKPHRHSFYQILWFHEVSDHYVDFGIHSLQPQSLVFLDKNQVHYFCPNSVNEGILIHFNDYFLIHQQEDAHKYLRYLLFNGLGTPHNKIPPKEHPKLVQLLALMQQELAQGGFQQKELLYHLFSSFLVLVERIKRQDQSTKEEVAKKADLDYEVLFAFRKTIEQNLAKALTVNELSESLHTHPKKLSLLTQTYLHQTPAQFIAQRKTLEAKRLLSNTQLSIKEVAYALGFDQATYFTKFFKKQTTLTPKEFRVSLP